MMKNELLIPLGYNKYSKYNTAFSSLLIFASAALLTFWQYNHISCWPLTLSLTAVVYYLTDNEKDFLPFRVLSVGMYAFCLINIVFMRHDDSQPTLIYYLVALVPLVLYCTNRCISNRSDLKVANKTFSTLPIILTPILDPILDL